MGATFPQPRPPMQEHEPIIPPPPSPKKDMGKITVSGVTFGPDDVVSAVVKLDGREVYIQKKEDQKKIGFAGAEQ